VSAAFRQSISDAADAIESKLARERQRPSFADAMRYARDAGQRGHDHVAAAWLEVAIRIIEREADAKAEPAA